MKNLLLILTIALLAIPASTIAQVKVGNNVNTIDNNSLLELESTNKGFLMPRVVINDVDAAAPLSAPIPTGMIVYSTGGTVKDGFYYWNSSKWVTLATDNDLHLNTVTKTATGSILKTENFVMASNDITLTLPSVSAADNGLAITVKNTGTVTDLITVQGNGGATMDGMASMKLTRLRSQTFVAYNGDWLVKEKKGCTENLLDVAEEESWTNIADVILFLNEHMTGPTVVRFSAGTFDIDATQTINLPYPVTFEGLSYGETSINGTAGVSGSPLFICQTECYFKKFVFNAFANTAGNDGIRFTGSGTYHEVKDCYFVGFNKGIVSTNNNDIWAFEIDFEDCANAGIEIAAGAAAGGRLRMSEDDFIQCGVGVKLQSGVNESISILNGTFYNTPSGSDIGILYVPATFTAFNSIFISNTAWNNEGTYISGFDFSRADGRDANAFLQSNAGMGDQNPRCKINVRNNATTTTVTTANTWYKCNWTNTSATTIKWTIANNRITYQPANRKSVMITITGNLQVNNSSRTISVGIIKSGATGTRYGECDLRVVNANQPFQFATVLYVDDVGPGDYFELYCTSQNNSDIVTFQDVQWYTDTK
ncbi:MAG: hypothetical protein V2A54_09700 [Bacteroidota bacterium]